MEARGETFRPIRMLAAAAAFVLLIYVPLPAETGADGSPLLTGPARRLLAVTAAMAVLWFTEAIPVAATALLPVAAYPYLGIADSRAVAGPYINQLTFLFLGGMLLAAAIEIWDVHRRIALEVMRRVGTSPRALTAGLMLVSAGLSMWISNTATSMLLLPIGLALLSQLGELTPDLDKRQRTRLSVALLLAIAYGANVGGMATPVGTPTNAALLGFWDTAEQMPGPSPSVGEWFVVAAPFCGAMLLATTLVLTWRLPRGAADVEAEFFRQRLEKLGPLSGGGRVVLALFAVTATAWMTRRPIALGDVTVWPGWEPAVVDGLRTLGIDADGFPHDSTVAILAAVLLFVVPGRTADGTRRPLLRWDEAESRLPWGVLLLFGSGFTIAAAFESTGLATWTGEVARQALDGAPQMVVVGGSALVVTFLTEFTTNVATISTLLPALSAMSQSLQIDPRLVCVPATLAASCAFMLPIATPPNAVVYGSGKLPLGRMIANGVLLNLLSVVLLTLIGGAMVRLTLL